MKHVIARKKSSDPAQEQLREEKSYWNSEMSQLIGELISLKKGINGKEVDVYSIPASSIKDPMPTQVNSLLSQVSNNSSNVLGEARNIIHHQQEYSDHRKKAVHAFLADEDIEKYASIFGSSWVGSRLKASITRLLLNKVERKYRKEMIESCVDLFNQFKEFEDDLLDSNRIPQAFTKLNSIILSYRGSVLDQFKKLDIYFEELKTKQESANPFDKIQNEDESGNTKTKEQSEQQTSITDLIKSPPKPSKEESKKIDKKVEKEVENIKSEESQDEEFNKLLILYKQAQNKSEKIKQYLIGLRVFEKTPAEIKKRSNELSLSFSKLLVQINKILGGSSVDLKKELTKFFFLYKEIYEFLSTNESLLKEINKNWNIDFIQPGITKEAASNSISRWVKTQILKMKKGSHNYMLLQCVLLSKENRNQLDLILGILEDKDSGFGSLEQELKKLNNQISELIDKMMLMGNKYSLEIRRDDPGKHKHLRDITETDIRKLMDASRQLKMFGSKS